MSLLRQVQKRLYIIVCTASLLCTACTPQTSADSGSVSGSSGRQDPVRNTDEAEAAMPQQLQAVPSQLEEAVEAQPGEAFLAVTDKKSFLQYWGEKTDILCYDAVTAPITRNGSYTVSVTADTRAARYDATGKPDGELTVSGLGFLSVMIKDGAELFPDAVITVDRVTIDGRELNTTAKNYTVAEEQLLRADIWNPYLESIPADAVCEKGAFFVKGDINRPAFDAGDDYTAQIIRAGRIKDWKTVSVRFTVSGLSEKDKQPDKPADKKHESKPDNPEQKPEAKPKNDSENT